MSHAASNEITQRELRNDSGAVLRSVEAGETYIVTRNGTPVAELRPLRRQTFVPTTQLLATFSGQKPLDSQRFLSDLDDVVDQGFPDE
jgi:prevent-host-death family protein